MEVYRSARGKHWKLRDISQRDVAAMMRAAGVSDITARVLVARGVTPEASVDYLSPKLRSFMPDPNDMTDMVIASQRAVRAIAGGERIGIIADFDVDGITSLSLLRNFLRAFGCEPISHVPCRLSEGYGPSESAVKMMAEAGVNLLFTLDCGSTAKAELEQATNLGLDVIVLDHHQISDIPTNVTAVVNPNRADDHSGLGHLAACGVVFMFLAALRRDLAGLSKSTDSTDNTLKIAETASGFHLLGLLDLVALGTVCDVVPLVGLNRAFVRQGLKIIQTEPRAGLLALLDVTRVRRPISVRHLAFSLGPRINAAGRLGQVGVAIDIFDDSSNVNHRELAYRLNELNFERQKLENAIVTSAMHFAAPQVEAGRRVVCVADDHWHRGVLGLVAGRIRVRYDTPALAVTFSDHRSDASLKQDVEGIGSARGVTADQTSDISRHIDVGAMIREAVDFGILESGGGHTAAAGFRVLHSRWQDLCSFVEVYAKQHADSEVLSDPLWVDGIIDTGAPSHDAIMELSQIGPFGSGNDEPTFLMSDQYVVDLQTFGDGHMKCTLQGREGSARAVAFRAFENRIADALRSECRLHVVAAFDTGSFGPQARIIDAAPCV